MAGEGDAERLVVLLEARIRDFEKNMAKASGTATKNYAGMRKGSSSATRQMESDMVRSTTRINQALASTSSRVGAFSKSFALGVLAPVAGLLTLRAAINGTREALTDFDRIAKQAKAAGLDGEFFQQLGYQAKLGGVEIDQLSAALNTFNKNAGLAAAGRGELVEKLKLLDPVLLSNIRNAATQEQRIRMVADAISKETDASKQAAIAAAVFGDAGVKMVEVLRGGSAAIDESMRKAKELGIVIDRDVLANAERMNDEFTTASEIVDIKLKQAFINLAPFMVQAAGWAADLARLLGVAADQLKEIDDRTSIRPLQNQLVEIENKRATLMMEIGALKDNLAKLDPASGWAGTITAEIRDKAAAAEQLMQQALQYQERIAQLQGKPAGPPRANPPAASGGFDPIGTGAGSFASFASDMGVTKVEAVAAGFGRVSDAAADATRAIATSTDAVDQLREQFQTAEDMAQSFTSGLISDLASGRDAVGAVADAFKNLGTELIQMAANQAIKMLFSNLIGAVGGGFGTIGVGGVGIPGGGFIPGLTGPKLFAKGGVTDQPAIFGDAGPEAAVPLPDGRSIPVDLKGTDPAANKGGGDLTVNVTFQGGAKGNQEIVSMVHQGITAALRQFDGDILPTRVPEIMKNPWRRGSTIF